MKTIIALILTIFVLSSFAKANEPDRSESIQIHIRQAWRIQITRKGAIAIQSSTDSHPMANAHTGDNIAVFDKVMKMLTDDLASFPDGGEARTKIAWAFIPGKKDKIPVSEESILKLLELASGHWAFPGLTTRISERLQKNPILTDIEKQNKALHPTEGAVVPK